MPTFKPKNFHMIVASMVNWMANNQGIVTDFNAGAVTRTMLESVGLEMEEYYYRTFNEIGAAVAEAVYTAFEFPRLPPTYATGKLKFSRSTPAAAAIPIPNGTIVQTVDGKQYQVSVSDAVIPSGGVEVLLVDATALGTGSFFNVDAGSVIRMVTPVGGVEAVTNTTPMSGGSDTESDVDRRARFNLFIQSLSRGTLAALEFAALNVPQVETAKAVDSLPAFALSYERGASFNTGTGLLGDSSIEANTPHEQRFGMLDTLGSVGASFFVAASEMQFDALYVDLAVAGVSALGPLAGIWEYYEPTDPSGWRPIPPTREFDIDEFTFPAPGEYYIYLAATHGDVREWFVYGSQTTVLGSTSNDATYTIRKVDYDEFGTQRTILRVVEAVNAEPGAGVAQVDADGTASLSKSGTVRFDVGGTGGIGSAWQNVVFADGITEGALGRRLFPIRFIEADGGGGVGTFTTNPECIQLFTKPEPGWVHLFASEAGSVLSDAVKAEVESAVELFRSAGIQVRVYGPIERLVSIAVRVRPSGAFVPDDVKALVKKGLENYTSSFSLGQSMYVSGLVQYIMNLNTDAVFDVEIDMLDGKTTLPLPDVVAAPNQLLLMDALNITVDLM